MLGGPALWWLTEFWVSRGYQPSYSYFGNFTSDLGVTYPFVERTANRHAVSTRAKYMNANFYTKGVLFAVGQLALIRARGQRGTLAIAHGTLAVLVGYGLYLVAKVHGGSREHENGSVKWHSLGAMMGIGLSNICCILSGLSDSNVGYRRASVLLGSTGLVNLVNFVLQGRTPMKGFWQRGCIYTTFFYEVLTGYAILQQLSKQRSLAIR
jgi:hypothetical protein